MGTCKYVNVTKEMYEKLILYSVGVRSYVERGVMGRGYMRILLIEVHKKQSVWKLKV